MKYTNRGIQLQKIKSKNFISKLFNTFLYKLTTSNSVNAYSINVLNTLLKGGTYEQ